MKKTGKQLQDALCKQGINALWIGGKGMIFMSSYYGVNTSVSGNYRLYSRAVAEKVNEEAKHEGFELETALHMEEIPGKYHKIG
jgi:hypothetical protein